jgi:hypothetical protein
MDLTSSPLRSVSYPLPLYAFLISCLVYLFARILLSFIHPNKQIFGPISSLDRAEKGSLRKQDDMSDEEIFQLEKRAFFSKVTEATFRKPPDWN